MQVILGIIVGIIIAFTYKGFFGNDKLDEAEARNVELARQLKKELNENKNLRKTNQHNNIVLLNKNRKQEKFIKEIIKLSEVNTYNNERIIFSKIKELVHDYKSKN